MGFGAQTGGLLIGRSFSPSPLAQAAAEPTHPGELTHPRAVPCSWACGTGVPGGKKEGAQEGVVTVQSDLTGEGWATLIQRAGKAQGTP